MKKVIFSVDVALRSGSPCYPASSPAGGYAKGRATGDPGTTITYADVQ